MPLMEQWDGMSLMEQWHLLVFRFVRIVMNFGFNAMFILFVWQATSLVQSRRRRN